MRLLRHWVLVLAAALATGPGHATPLTRAQALRALEQPAADTRLAAIARLADIGKMADADRLIGRLDDADPQVRAAAAAAIWQIWSRSGDPAIDKLYTRGVEQMQAQALTDALATFSAIVLRKPDFAEGWNKRATIYFLLGRNDESLRDCDEVFKRNRKHFGALAGAGQIHLQLGHAELALDFFRRAVAVNPNLKGPAEMIPILEELLHQQRPVTT
ncbi:MAG TPA: tetratricopeptide repeat protein [Caldimonas sp.]|nr:tetratricopeptide repeat protein [Caldimonas sp.]